MAGQPGDGTSQILLSCRRPQFQSKQGILAQLGDESLIHNSDVLFQLEVMQ